MERARDLFEQCLEKCPPKYAKSIPILIYFIIKLFFRYLFALFKIGGGTRIGQTRHGNLQSGDGGSGQR